MSQPFLTQSNLYLRVPYHQREDAKKLGAKWDADRKLWHALPAEDPLKFRNWWSFLEVPYEEKDEAKKLGAKFNGHLKKWGVPEKLNFDTFTKWWPDVCRQYLFQDRLTCIKMLAESGQATVFKSRGIADNREFAIKLFGNKLDQTIFSKESFQREMTALDKLKGHKNILPLLDWGKHDTTGRFFIVTPWQDYNLSERFANLGVGGYLGNKDKPARLFYMPPKNKLAPGIDEDRFIPDDEYDSWLTPFDNILGGILDGLVYAFKNNIIHRDIKPENIFLDQQMDENDNLVLTPVIGDFGTSKNWQDAQPVGQHGVTFVGHHSAPWGPPREGIEVEHQNTWDVYSWGAVAVSIVIGEYPETYEDIKKLLDTELKKDLGVELHAYMSRVISMDPLERPQNVEQLQQEILELNDKYRKTRDLPD